MNFIDIDNYITSMLRKNIDMYKISKKRYESYIHCVDYVNGKLKLLIQDDLKRIEALKYYENILHLYKSKTKTLIKKYLNILRTPIKKHDIDKITEADKLKNNITRDYLDTLKMYIPYEIFENININIEETIDMNINYCDNCDNNELFIKEGDTIICCKCFCEIIKMAYFTNNNYSYTVNKCNYDRINHFKECLNQFQGKQNTFIHPDVYKNIDHALEINHLTTKKPNNKYVNVKKSHIMYFLKELGYSKHYDDYILIYSNLTGFPANNISHLEEDLINDFKLISKRYSEINLSIDRKNFINMQFILYKLLKKHNYQIDSDDFSNIKSIDKKLDRDEICKDIFNYYNWPYLD